MERTTWQPDTGPAPVWADFNDMPTRDTVGLDARQTRAELADLGIELREGMVLNVWDADEDDAGNRDDLIATGAIERWAEDRWVLRMTHPLRWQSGSQS
jgi:hypothetical protein